LRGPYRDFIVVAYAGGSVRYDNGMSWNSYSTL
jgi:hypothetical protein